MFYRPSVCKRERERERGREKERERERERERESLFLLQLVILMALAKGRSVVRSGSVTLHTQTAIHLAELMTKVCCYTIHKKKTVRGADKINYCLMLYMVVCHTIVIITSLPPVIISLITGKVHHRES